MTAGATTGTALIGDLAGWRPGGQRVTAPVFLRPAGKHGACSPRGSLRTLRARLTAIPRTESHPARMSDHNAALTLSVATATVRTNPARAQGTRGTTTT
jgi:hypothetical protein